MIWFVYLVECSDGTIYTGATNDVEKRIVKHNKGQGAKYTKSRRPVKLLKFIKCDSKKEALSLEYHIKQKSRAEKLRIIKEG
ncbi:MAG TPA: GIY-YIG nuclease family protein [Candidatus Glassbacteria bacterium]|nr:GIY-YIG nuclease family protein [Candidatus Glassbacteria bacterium]